MLKILYKPTGNTFILPDEEALRIKREDRGNDYKILDAGYQEQEVNTEEKTVQELVLGEEKVEVELPPKEQEKLDKENNDKEEQKTLLEEMTHPELLSLARKLELKPRNNYSKTKLIEMIKTTGIKI